MCAKLGAIVWGTHVPCHLRIEVVVRFGAHQLFDPAAARQEESYHMTDIPVPITVLELLHFLKDLLGVKHFLQIVLGMVSIIRI